jgi:hypothetical protein
VQFILGRPTKLPITIDGTDYIFPFFNSAAFDEHTAKYASQVMEDALAQFDATDREAKARFCLYFQVPPIDVLNATADLMTAKGCDIVIRWCAEHASPTVPADVLTQFLEEVPVPLKRQIAGKLLGADGFNEGMKTASAEPKPLKSGARPLKEKGGRNKPPPPTSDEASTHGT